MGMQYDVKAATLLNSGFLVKFRTRVKGISVKGTTSAGAVELFDTVTAPVAAKYARSANTITVTENGHGLKVGDQVGISFDAAGGVAATPGNYVIATVPDANTFTLTDINSGTVTSNTDCIYATKWIVTFRFATGDVYTNYWLVPGEGILAENGVYAVMTNLNATSIFYG
jgi:hypothetical protein